VCSPNCGAGRRHAPGVCDRRGTTGADDVAHERLARVALRQIRPPRARAQHQSGLTRFQRPHGGNAEPTGAGVAIKFSRTNNDSEQFGFHASIARGCVRLRAEQIRR
jgi:hypothetical protein